MQTASYQQRRDQLLTYFDRTAVDAWSKLTSDAPVGRIRATVRAGRDEMRAAILARLPANLTGHRVLDAGCGTGALAVECARRGAHVTAIDLSPTLVGLAQERTPRDLGAGSIDFQVGDMLDATLGDFSHVVAMDSLIHYNADDITRVLAGLASHTSHTIVATFAPRTPALTVMHSIGRFFPRGDRAPAIEPVSEARLRDLIGKAPGLKDWRIGTTHRVNSGFYMSQAMELIRP
ncbi:MAG: magnesium protoporphyrin IX methyltransferase [Alphaproteobacteria bacterium]